MVRTPPAGAGSADADEGHSHVGDVLHVRLALQDGERVDAPLRVHTGNPGTATGARGRACLRGHPQVHRAHCHPDHHHHPPPPPRPEPPPR